MWAEILKKKQESLCAMDVVILGKQTKKKNIRNRIFGFSEVHGKIFLGTIIWNLMNF